MTGKKVLVLGSTGMLGRAVYKNLKASSLTVLQASRSSGLVFDAEFDPAELLLEKAGLRSGDFVVNCVGLTKAHIDESSTKSIERAVRLNVMFPIALAHAAERLNVRIIQVATDCVFSGDKGNYIELDFHDANDVYGKTKSLGEVPQENLMLLRCSLIGPEEPGRGSLLFDWVRGLAESAEIEGYTNHRWNGITSGAFAQIVQGIVLNEAFTSGVQHLVPRDAVSKFSLIELILSFLGRTDVQIHPKETERKTDRTLATSFVSENRHLFELGGYDSIPTIAMMLSDIDWARLNSAEYEL